MQRTGRFSTNAANVSGKRGNFESRIELTSFFRRRPLGYQRLRIKETIRWRQYFEMQGLGRGAAGGANPPNHLSRLDLLTLTDDIPSKMRIAGAEPVVMPYFNKLSVTA